MKKLIQQILSVALLAFTPSAFSNPILTDLPVGTYITVNDLDWAWASPVAKADWFGGNILYAPDLHQGWRYATAAELASRPDASAFLALSNTAAAVPYWNSSFTHIDYNDGLNGVVTSLPTGSFHESWYVRDAAPSSVPDATASLPLLGIAVGFLAFLKRKI